MTTRATNSGSDEGYTSSHYSPLKSKVKSEDERLRERFLVRQAKEFKQKYYIEKVIINSANGIIYQGKKLHQIVHLTRDRPLSDGLSTFDGQYTFDGQFTFGTVHFPSFGPSTFPRLV